jgi:hypothetical protein
VRIWSLLQNHSWAKFELIVLAATRIEFLTYTNPQNNAFTNSPSSRESHEHAREMSDNKDQQLAVYTKELQDQQDTLRQRAQELHHGHLKTLNAEHEAAHEG